MPQETFYFRESMGALYGSYHPPPAPPPASQAAPRAKLRPAAVVLCQPYGHEYLQSHRAFRLLAERLAQAGFPTLRFDYRGTGDSAGDEQAADLERWREDVRAAGEWCRARSGRQRLCAVGLRLGASLVALETSRERFDSAVLWDPVVTGRKYLEELEALELQFRRGLPGGDAARAEANGAVLGFEYPPALRSSIGALDLSAARAQGTRAALWIRTGAGPGGPEPALGCPREERALVSDPRIWVEDADKALVPTEAIGRIVDWLSEVYA